jgi:hypothetical protein
MYVGVRMGGIGSAPTFKEKIIFIVFIRHCESTAGEQINDNVCACAKKSNC